MTQADIDGLAELIVRTVRDAIKPIQVRLADIEARLDALPQPKEGDTR